MRPRSPLSVPRVRSSEIGPREPSSRKCYGYENTLARASRGTVENEKNSSHRAQNQLYMGIASYSKGRRNSMSEPEGIDLSDQNPVEPGTAEPRHAAPPRPRAIGSPLPMGVSRRQQLSPEQGDVRRLAQAPPPGRALSGGAPAEEPSFSVQRIMSALRSALPLVQRILPLLDGNIASAVSNLVAPHPHPQASAPAPKVDLAPIEDGMAALQTQHREFARPGHGAEHFPQAR